VGVEAALFGPQYRGVRVADVLIDLHS
jgi:hypothetical protein